MQIPLFSISLGGKYLENNLCVTESTLSYNCEQKICSTTVSKRGRLPRETETKNDHWILSLFRTLSLPSIFSKGSKEDTQTALPSFDSWVQDFRSLRIIPRLSKECLEEMRERINKFQSGALKGSISKDDCFALLELFAIVNIKKAKRSLNAEQRKISRKKDVESKFAIEGNFFIELAPILARSNLDPDVRIAASHWGVTLICAKGSSDPTLLDVGNHAEMIIEGIRERRYFMMLAHLRMARQDHPEAKISDRFVDIHEFDPSRLEYHSRDKVQLVPFEKVKKMIESIEIDKKNPPQLCALGSRSIFAKKGEESCFTYLRGKFKMVDIDIGDSFLDWIVAVTKFYTPYEGKKLREEDHEN